MPVDYLMTDRERFLVYQLDLVYAQRYHSHPSTNRNLVYFLGDRFEYAITWSANGRLPCYRKNPARFLHRQSYRFMSGQEKMASLGWPVNAKLAENMLTSPAPCIDPDRSDFLAGQSMHISNASIVLLMALCCFSPISNKDEPDDRWKKYVSKIWGAVGFPAMQHRGIAVDTFHQDVLQRCPVNFQIPCFNHVEDTLIVIAFKAKRVQAYSVTR